MLHTLRYLWQPFAPLLRSLAHVPAHTSHSPPLRVRSRYTAPASDKLNWFPGHMRAGMYQIQAKMRSVDVLVEVHDARIPYSGRNWRLSADTGRPRLLVLNKCDLVRPSDRQPILDSLARARTLSCGLRVPAENSVVFLSCRNQANSGSSNKDTSEDPGSDIGQLMQAIIALARQHRTANARLWFTQDAGLNVMIVGVPNVGKSTIINRLRANHRRLSVRATRVGATPGVTRSVLNRIRVHERPDVYLLDTPGILLPDRPTHSSKAGAEAYMRLGLCAALHDNLVGPESIADYLLYWCNRRQEFDYASALNMVAPNDCVGEVLTHVAEMKQMYSNFRDVANRAGKQRRHDLYQAARYMIREFRFGNFGRFCLDDDYF